MLANTRLLISLLAILIYLCIFRFYLHELHISWHWANIIYNILTASALLFYHYNKCDTSIIDQLNDVLFWTIISNFILIILLRFDVISELDMFHIFNGSIFAVTMMIGISFFRHGYFSKKYND